MFTFAMTLALAAAPASALIAPGSGPIIVYQDNRGLSCGSRIADGARTNNRIAASRVKKQLLAAGYAPVKIIVLEDGQRVLTHEAGSVLVQGVSPESRCN